MNSEHEIRKIAELIKQSNKIIVMSGAGISTSAKIPDFRTNEIGLYDSLKCYPNAVSSSSSSSAELRHPTDVFSIDFFKKNPKPFYDIVFELYPVIKNAKPTITHKFIEFLNRNGKLLRHYTQNVDGLDRLAGLPEDKLIEAHGNIKSASCLSCKTKFKMEIIEECILNKEIPMCLRCKIAIKPDFVFFGESLPFNIRNKSDWKKCDLLIVLGTSLVVQPFASLIENVKSNCPRIFINKTEYENIHDKKDGDIFIYDDCDKIFTELSKVF